MTQLHLALLGPPEIRRGDQLITFPTRKSVALLAYLAAEGGAQPRERIMALLWPDSSAELGRTSLRKTLAYVRQGFGADQGGIVAERDTLRLDQTHLTVDLWGVQNAAQAFRQPPLATPGALTALPSAQIQRLLHPLQQAIARYRGDFLAGFSLSDAIEFDDWATLQRESLQRQALLIFDRLAHLQFEIGDLPAAIDTAARWVAHDPLNEAAYRRLMQLHFANGDRAAALQCYAACQTLLERELDVAPAPETEALAHRIQYNKVTRWQDDKATHPSSSVVTPSPLHPVTSSPFVGRAFEHLQLVAAFRKAQAGQVQIITLEGEPGIGKTRLAHEFLAWAAAQGATVGQSRAQEMGDRLPYQPIVEALRLLLSRPISGADLAQPALSPIWLNELSRLLPELAEQAGPTPNPQITNEAEARLRLYEAITRLLGLLARAAPLVLFIDDLHWADSASLAVLHYAARRWNSEQQPVLLLLALRSEEVAANPALRDWLSALHRESAVTRLTLSSLSLADTQRLVQALGMDEPPTQNAAPDAISPFARQLFAETSGQPFFIIQLLRALAESKPGAEDAPAPVTQGQALLRNTLPHGVRELIESRLSRLSQRAQSCIGIGTVLGNGFLFEDLCAVAELDETTTLAALEELLVRGLCREVGSEEPLTPTYIFTHDRIREVAYAQLSEARRRLLHRKALTTLQQRQARQIPAAVLAHHARLAGLAALAFRWSARAGEEALRLFALDDAIAHFEQAQRFWRAGAWEQSAEDVTACMHLQQRLGRAYDLNHQSDLSTAAYTSLLTLARQNGDQVMECRALNGLATTQAHTYHNLDAAFPFLVEAHQVAQASANPTGLAETAWNLAQLNFYRGQVRVALTHAEEALALAQTVDEPELLARTFNILAYLHPQVGQWSSAAQCAEEAVTRYRQLGDQAMIVDSLCVLSEARLNLGEAATSQTAAESGLALAVEIGNGWGQVNGHFHLALALLDQGDATSALEDAQDACRLAVHHNLVTLLAVAHIVLGNVEREMGDLAAAIATHQAAEQFNEQMAAQPFRAPVATALCADYVLAGEWQAAYTWAKQAIEQRSRSLDFHAGFAFDHLIAALLRQGEVDTARQQVQDFADFAGDSPRYRAPYLRALALLAEWEDGPPLLPLTRRDMDGKPVPMQLT